MIGTNMALYDAWEMALKSVLVNAPTDTDLKVHMLCNEDAHHMVKDKIDTAGLAGSRWRNQITIISYSIEPFNDTWRRFLLEKLGTKTLYKRVSLGGYYRLFAHNVLGELDIGPALYMDSDVVILSNLNDLMNNMDETKLLQGSSSTWFCSGFVLVNVKRFDKFWEKVDQLDMDPMPISDQDIRAAVLTKFPETFGWLPKEWDRNHGNGWRRNPNNILNQKEATGMLHFQGCTGRNQKENLFYQWLFTILLQNSSVL
jgi:lipopolysaccharide biosynthesis glycosyltransferase